MSSKRSKSTAASATRRTAERAAAVRAAQQRSERRRRLIIGGAVALAVVLLVGVVVAVQAGRDSTGDVAREPAGVTDGHGVVLGEATAPTTVTVYEDFGCPVCAVFEEATVEPLREAAEAGRIRLDYRMVSFLDRAFTDDYSTRALNAAVVVLDSAGPEAFADFHDALFAEQPAEGGPGLPDDRLVELAVAAGGEESVVRSRIEDLAFEQWTVNATDAMSRAGVTGTPTVLIDGELVEGASLAEVVEATLAAAT